MAKSQLLNFTQNLKMGSTTIQPGDTTTSKVVYTAGANDTIVKCLQAVSDDTATQYIKLFVNIGGSAGSDTYLGNMVIPAASGTTSSGTTPTAAVDLLSSVVFVGLPYDATGKRVLPLPAGSILKVATTTTITTGKTITVTAIAEDY